MTRPTQDDLALLTPAERREVERLCALAPLWLPLPGPQTMAFDSLADVVGFGGSAGGGKTDLAIGLGLCQHQKVSIFRQTGTELPAIIDRLSEILGTRDGWDRHGILRTKRHDGVPVQIELGSFPNHGDEEKYRGRPNDLLVFDEASQMRSRAVQFLMGWNRTVDPAQRCRVLMCFNPPQRAEGRWVVSYFAPWLDRKHPRPAEPGELRWFATIDGKDCEVPTGEAIEHKGETIRPSSRTFIPSRITDNPHLMATGYMRKLMAMPEPLRSQLLYGDFTAGTMDDPFQVIPTGWVEAAQARWVKPLRLEPMDSVGVDVARGGQDETVIARRHGAWFDEPLAFKGSQTPDGPAVAGLVVAHARDRAVIHVDVIGVGASPYDFLVQQRQQVVGVNVSERSLATDKSGRLRFKNMRSELWWKMREFLDPTNNTGAVLPPSPRLLADLTAPLWSVSGDKLEVQSREEIVEKLGRSPDYASAYCLALIDTPKVGWISLLQEEQKRGADFDPYADL